MDLKIVPIFIGESNEYDSHIQKNQQVRQPDENQKNAEQLLNTSVEVKQTLALTNNDL